MNLYLDDERSAPDGYTVVRTVAEAKAIIKAGGVHRLSLDYDLADGHTGMELCTWMGETNTWPAYRPLVHSGNPTGAQLMKAFVAKFCSRPSAPPKERGKAFQSPLEIAAQKVWKH